MKSLGWFVVVAFVFVAGFFTGGKVAQYNNEKAHEARIVAEFRHAHGVEIPTE